MTTIVLGFEYHTTMARRAFAEFGRRDEPSDSIDIESDRRYSNQGVPASRGYWQPGYNPQRGG